MSIIVVSTIVEVAELENCYITNSYTLKISAIYQREKIEKQVQEIQLKQYIHLTSKKLIKNVAGFVSFKKFFHVNGIN